MRRLCLVVLVSLLATIALVQPATASDCRFCLDSLVLQTRDGGAWSAGQPLALVVHVGDTTADTLPSGAQIVVMQTDGDRTKCLGVPLKLVSTDASGATYAGVFFPFRAAHYDGVLQVGEDVVQNIAFDVHQVSAGAAPAGELPAAEPLDTSARGPLDTLVSALRSIIALVS
jgi:hypothetical protein